MLYYFLDKKTTNQRQKNLVIRYNVITKRLLNGNKLGYRSTIHLFALSWIDWIFQR